MFINLTINKKMLTLANLILISTIIKETEILGWVTYHKWSELGEGESLELLLAPNPRSS